MQQIELFKVVAENQNQLNVIFSGSTLQGIASSVPAGQGSGSELWQAEAAVLILYGEGEAKVGKETFPVKTGDLFLVPAETPYDVVNESKEDLKLLHILSQTLLSEDTNDVNKAEELVDPYRVPAAPGL